MKIKAFDPQELPEKDLYLKLEEHDCGVVIVCCDMYGEPISGMNIGAITNEGVLLLYGSVTRGRGITTDPDNDNRIKLGG